MQADEKKTILVVDDDLIIRTTLDRFLKNSYNLILVDSGEKALEFLKSNTPSLMILDINMPKMDGFQVLKKIKQDPRLDDMFIIMISAQDDEKDVVTSIELGAHGYITKPLIRTQVVKQVNELLEKEVTKTKLYISPDTRTLRNILCVDDEDINLKILSRILSSKGYIPTLAHSGVEALNNIISNTYDAVILDLIMPGKNGIDVLKSIRSHPELKSLPVFIFTALVDADSAEIEEAQKLGIADILHKPVNAADITQSIENYLQRQRLQAYIRARISKDGDDYDENNIVSVERSSSQPQTQSSAKLMQSDPITKVTGTGEIDPLHSMLHIIPEFYYIVTDYKGINNEKIIHVTPNFCKITQWPLPSILNKDISVIFGSATPDEDIKDMKEAKLTGSQITLTTLLYQYNRKIYYYGVITAIPIKDVYKNTRHYLYCIKQLSLDVNLNKDKAVLPAGISRKPNYSVSDLEEVNSFLYQLGISSCLSKNSNNNSNNNSCGGVGGIGSSSQNTIESEKVLQLQTEMKKLKEEKQELQKRIQQLETNDKKRVLQLTTSVQKLQTLNTMYEEEKARTTHLLKEATEHHYLPSVLFKKSFRNPSQSAPGQTLLKINNIFKSCNGVISKENINELSMLTNDICGFPAPLSIILYNRICKDKNTKLTLNVFMDYYQNKVLYCDTTLKYWNLLNVNEKTSIGKDELKPLLQIFLSQNDLDKIRRDSNLHKIYIDTVTIAIFYTVSKQKYNELSLSDLKSSNLIEAFFIALTSNVNRVQIFSSEYIMNIYSDFISIDGNRDGLINIYDFKSSSKYSLTNACLEQVLSGKARKLTSPIKNTMNYIDFVWFYFFEKDRMADSSIEYWFRCLDYDIDGYIGADDMLYFLQCKQKQMSFQELTNWGTPENLLYQLLDLIRRPKGMDKISALDIRRSNCGETLFDVLLSLKEKGDARKYF